MFNASNLICKLATARTAFKERIQKFETALADLSENTSKNKELWTTISGFSTSLRTVQPAVEAAFQAEFSPRLSRDRYRALTDTIESIPIVIEHAIPEHLKSLGSAIEGLRAAQQLINENEEFLAAIQNKTFEQHPHFSGKTLEQVYAEQPLLEKGKSDAYVVHKKALAKVRDLASSILFVVRQRSEQIDGEFEKLEEQAVKEAQKAA